MPLQRYLCVEGVRDANGIVIPVTNPHHLAIQTGATPRFVGAKLKAEPEKDPISVMDHYEPAREVVLDHTDLRRAIQASDLKQIGVVSRKSHEEAVREFALPRDSAEEPRGAEHKTKGAAR